MCLWCLVRRVLVACSPPLLSDQFHFLSAPGFALHPHQLPPRPDAVVGPSESWEQWQQGQEGLSCSMSYFQVTSEMLWKCKTGDFWTLPELLPFLGGESQVRSAPWLPLRRSAPCPQDPTHTIHYYKKAMIPASPQAASWWWPSLAMGSSPPR